MTTTFESLNPATGEVIATFPVEGAEEVAAAVDRARAAAAWWSGLGFAGRRLRLGRVRRELTRGQAELAALVHRENGKPVDDAALEVMVSIDHLDWAARHARHVLGERRVRSGLLAINHRSTVEYRPLGVVGVIGPWNYPVLTPIGSIAYALAAGNTVVYKPSEYTPAVGRWLVDAVNRCIPEHPVLQLTTGFGATGDALCRAHIDKLAFTGSARTGRRVMVACADRLTPVLMECGGNDAMIVDDDADVAAAARAAVWGGMSNGGQACIAVERVYATDRVYDALVAHIRAEAVRLHAGADAPAHYGPITMPGQVDVIERHVRDALDRGARAVVGGVESVHRPYVDPIVLVDVPADAAILHEETFGPVLPVIRVRNADQAVALANASPYGLASSVFGRRNARRIARGLIAGMTTINSVLTNAFIPGLPFGGVGESGFGRIHGADGLREFTRAHAITRQRWSLPADPASFHRPATLMGRMARLTRVRHGR